MKKSVSIFAAGLLLSCLSACQTAQKQQEVPGALPLPQNRQTAMTAMGTVSGIGLDQYSSTHLLPVIAVGSLMGGAMGQYYDTKMYVNQVRAKGGQVVDFGNEVRIILPADALFEPDGVDIKPQAYRFLARTTRVISNFGQRPLLITGFTDDIPLTNHNNEEFSYLRAQSVAAFLWAHGIPNELMTVQGMGTAPDIATNRTISGSAANRRIEIHLTRTD